MSEGSSIPQLIRLPSSWEVLCLLIVNYYSKTLNKTVILITVKHYHLIKLVVQHMYHVFFKEHITLHIIVTYVLTGAKIVGVSFKPPYSVKTLTESTSLHLGMVASTTSTLNHPQAR
jgi:hypothetical protein